MASIKLKHSGGNGVIIAAPTSNPSSDKTLTLPSTETGTIVSKDSANSLQNITGINGGQLGNRNLIIGGAMNVAQRGTSFADASNSYTLDRFLIQNSSGTPAFTVTQDTDAPHGFNNSLKVACTTADASPAAGSFSRIRHTIEAQNLSSLAKGTASAKAQTLSFYVKTNKTGVYTVFVFDDDNTRMMSASYTVSDTNWNRYTIDIPADTTGAMADDNGAGYVIHWGLSLGSNRTSGSLQSAWTSYTQANEHVGNVNFADNTSNVWAITGVQLEVGSVATDFEHRSYADELRRCQRYFWSAINANHSGDEGAYLVQGTYYGNSKMTTHWYHPETMRTNPTVSFATGTNYYNIYRAGGSDTFNSLGSVLAPTAKSQTRFTLLEIQSNVGGTGGHSGIVGASDTAVYVHFSAEL